MPASQEKNIYQLFRLSVILKGIISFLEIVAGIAAFFISPAVIAGAISSLLRKEFIEDPHDLVTSHLLQAAQQFSITSSLFIALYLLSRGLIKFVLVIALLKGKLWAYPVSLGVLLLFVLYQVYQMVLSYSNFILLLTLFDLVVMYFIWREYKIVDKHLHSRTIA